MISTEKVLPNMYRDSVSLMQLSARIAALPGVQQAAAIMATPGNLDLLSDAGLINGRFEAGANDLLIVVQASDEAALAGAMSEAESALSQAAPTDNGEGGAPRAAPHSIEMGLEESPTANLALISTPGEFAAAEARKALRLGLNVMLFSDNVALEDEIELKIFARDRDLMVMGPDCGTAVIDGVPLGFANVVRRGGIGAVAASGTGLQQLTCLIDRHGQGVSQAIGIGGRDLHERVGGICMLQAIAALAGDPDTKVIVLISKPPAPAVVTKVLSAAKETGKPIVVNFLGANPKLIERGGIHAAETLEDAADMAVALVKGTKPVRVRRKLPKPLADALAREAGRLAPGQRYIRGLYSGGTFCYEALLLLAPVLGPVWSSTPLRPEHALDDVWKSREHTVIDLGDDTFTRGRPHPMIDQRLRNERMLTEAEDPDTAVILLDVVLGYGSHEDPAAEIVPAIEKARDRAQTAGRHLVFVASVCGTSGDPQGLERQERALRDAGVLLAKSNAEAVRAAATFAAARG